MNQYVVSESMVVSWNVNSTSYHLSTAKSRRKSKPDLNAQSALGKTERKKGQRR